MKSNDIILMYLLTRMVSVFPSNSTLSVSLGLQTLWDAPIKLLVCLLENFLLLKIFTHMWENHKLNNELIKSVNYFISVLTSSLLALGEVILKDVNFSSAFCNEKCKLDRKSKLWNLNSPKIFHKIIVYFIQ